MKPFKSVVIGLGQIGMGYDYDCCDDSNLLTHSSGFFHHPAYELCAAVELNAQKRALFTKKYNAPVFASIEQCLSEIKADVVSIGVPTIYHFETFTKVLEYLPKAIICEKPISYNISEARKMVTAALEKNCVMLVNYIRRFEPGVLELRQKIQSNFFGEVYKGTVLYTKGLSNNASHFVDLMCFLFNKNPECKITLGGRNLNSNDCEPDFILKFNNIKIHFIALREECFSVAEFELWSEGAKIKYAKFGQVIQYWSIEDDKIFPGYKQMSENAITLKSDLLRHQWYALENLQQKLTGGHNELYSAGESALHTLEIIEQLKQLREAQL